MDKANQYIEEIMKLEDTIKAMRHEVYLAVYSNKSDGVKLHYLQNAMRYADETLDKH